MNSWRVQAGNYFGIKTTIYGDGPFALKTSDGTVYLYSTWEQASSSPCFLDGEVYNLAP
jgi:hypothetical protein